MDLRDLHNLLPPFRRPRPGQESRIAFGCQTGSRKLIESESVYSRSELTWPVRAERLPIPGLVVYSQLDGGFSVWDPARNNWSGGGADQPVTPPAYRFKPDEVWDGLPLDSPKKLSNGLIADWASWQRESAGPFSQLTRVLAQLSSSTEESLRPGKLMRISISDARDHPTLLLPYRSGARQNVPLVVASAGIRRIAALAYVLVWTWQEHLRAASFEG